MLFLHRLCKATCIKVLRALMGFSGPEKPHLRTLTCTSLDLWAPFHLSLGPWVSKTGCRFTSLQLQLRCSHTWVWLDLGHCQLWPHEQTSEPSHPGAMSDTGYPHQAWSDSYPWVNIPAWPVLCPDSMTPSVSKSSKAYIFEINLG